MVEQVGGVEGYRSDLGQSSGAGLEFVEGDLGGHTGCGQCLGGTAAHYNGRGGAAELLGAEGGQDSSGSARIFWRIRDIVLTFHNNTPCLVRLDYEGRYLFRQE